MYYKVSIIKLVTTLLNLDLLELYNLVADIYIIKALLKGLDKSHDCFQII